MQPIHTQIIQTLPSHQSLNLPIAQPKIVYRQHTQGSNGISQVHIQPPSATFIPLPPKSSRIQRTQVIQSSPRKAIPAANHLIHYGGKDIKFIYGIAPAQNIGVKVIQQASQQINNTKYTQINNNTHYANHSHQYNLIRKNTLSGDHFSYKLEPIQQRFDRYATGRQIYELKQKIILL